MSFSFWDLVLSVFWFMLPFAWIGLLISIFGDVVRDHGLSGWAKALDQYVRRTAGTTPSTADEIAQLADLRDRDTIRPEEFAQAKARLRHRDTTTRER